MKIIVFGAGSVGCFVGGAWLAAGCDVRFIGREAIRAEIAEHGLALSDHEGFAVHFAPDRVDYSTNPAALRDADVIALTVKSTGTAAAAGEIARNARPGATLISFQNGVGNVDILKPLLPELTVLRGMVPYNVARTGPGRYRRGTWGDLAVERAPATEQLSNGIGDRSGRLLLHDDMVGVLWGKLLLNLNNAINALSGLPILAELKQRDFRRVLAAAQVEALALLREAGIRPARIGQIAPELMPHVVGAPDWVFNNLFLRIQKIDAAARSSMADDLAAGRATEIDFLNGEVVKLARSLGREAPVNRAIADLVKGAELGIERTWSAAQLRGHILQGHRGARGFGY